MCIVPHELLQFCRDEKIREIPACENNEDNFVDITGITEILTKRHDKWEFSPTVWKWQKSGLTMISHAYNLYTFTGMLINWTKSV